MKILHIIHSVNPVAGGPIEGIKQLALVKIRLGWQVEVVCLDSPDAPWVKDFELKVHAMGPSYLSYGYTPRFMPWLREHCHEYSFIVVNGIWQFSSFGAWNVLRKADVPYFVFTHGMLDPWFKTQYPLKHLKKWLYWPWGEYQVLRDATAVLFTCQEEKILARKSFCLYSCIEEVVNYGTSGWVGDADAQRKCFLEKFPHLTGKRILLFLGRIHEKKGGDLLVRAFHQIISGQAHPDLHLVLAGPNDNPFARNLKLMAQSLGIEDRITWTGMLVGDEKWGAFQAAEAFVLPSHQENFGIAVAEALSASLPVLISNKVNIWREIEQDNAGLVANDDLEGTCDLLKRWLSLDAAQREEMRKQARACFQQYFDITAAAQSLVRVYRESLTKKGRAINWTV